MDNLEILKLAKKCFADLPIQSYQDRLVSFYSAAFNAGVEAASNRLDVFQSTDHHQAAILSLKVKT